VSPRARTMLVRWEEFVAQFRKVVPRDATAPVESLRTSYLESGVPELELARRSA